MKTHAMRNVAASIAGLLLFAACGGTSTSTWTIAPVQPTPTGGAASPAASAGASDAPGSPAASVSPSGAPATPVTSPGASGVPASPVASADASAAAGQTVTLDLTGVLSITNEAGQTVSSLTVKDGETVHFVIDNTAGFPHSFFIGPADALAQNQVGDLPGIPDWSSGIQEFDYVVTPETASLEFACTVPGHYQLMHGTFTVES